MHTEFLFFFSFFFYIINVNSYNYLPTLVQNLSAIWWFWGKDSIFVVVFMILFVGVYNFYSCLKFHRLNFSGLYVFPFHFLE